MSVNQAPVSGWDATREALPLGAGNGGGAAGGRAQPDLVAILFDSLKCLQDQQRLALHSYVVMENHLHLVSNSQYGSVGSEFAARAELVEAHSPFDKLRANGKSPK